MGLSSSKAHPKVTQVAPMHPREDLPALTAPYRLPRMSAEPNLHPQTAEWGKPTTPQQLPPLRDTWYSRTSAGPLSFNTVLEKGETSIIKQHPPRRPQAVEKKGQSLSHPPGRRQHLHKLQMLDMTRRRREAELKRNLHREAKINKQKIKEFSPKNVLDTPQRGDSAKSRDLVPAEHNQCFHGDNQGNTWGRGLFRQHDGAEVSPDRRSKVDLWFCREPQTRDLFWDTSSTGSEEWESEEKIYRKPRLVRTKTERFSLFDDFFDKDF